MPKVSILMNCFNGEKYLREAIDSVISQTYKDWELIFWDNQSSDVSSKIVKSYNDSRIKYHMAPTHTSLYLGRSAALKLCTGQYLAFLDCDDLWFPEKLSKQLKVFDSDPEVVLVHSNTIFFNSNIGKGRVFNKRKRSSGRIFEEIIKSYYISLETVMVRMDTISANRIDFADFNLIGERDFLSAVSFYGKVQYLDEVLAKWRIHNNNLSKSLSKDHPKELKLMYLRLHSRFGKKFTKSMRINIFNEIIMRQALNTFSMSRLNARKKLGKSIGFSVKIVGLWIMSFLPGKFAMYILKHK